MLVLGYSLILGLCATASASAVTGVVGPCSTGRASGTRILSGNTAIVGTKLVQYARRMDASSVPYSGKDGRGVHPTIGHDERSE